MGNHIFILTPGIWFGEGKIQLNMIEEELLFHTSWTVYPKDSSDKIQCIQEIQIDGLSDNMRNELYFEDIHSETFAVEMNNDNIESIMGSGLIDKSTIAWEFRDNEMNFEGFEIYKLQEDGSYLMRAEYVTSDQFRTKIDGRIWQQVKQPQDQIELQDDQEDN